MAEIDLGKGSESCMAANFATFVFVWKGAFRGASSRHAPIKLSTDRVRWLAHSASVVSRYEFWLFLLKGDLVKEISLLNFGGWPHSLLLVDNLA